MEKLERLRELSREELVQKIGLHKEEIFNLRLTRTTKDLDNPIRLRDLRRGIAKLKTLLREDQLEVRKLAEPRSIGEKAPEKK